MTIVKKHRNKEAIRVLLEELSEVLDAFGVYGVGTVSADDVEAGNENHTDEEEDDDQAFYYDPWDIQSAVDGAMSNVLKSNSIPELSGVDQAPSLSHVLEVLFGEDHEFTKQAEYFEELISGYEDTISIDDLQEAYGVLQSVMEGLGWKKESK